MSQEQSTLEDLSLEAFRSPLQACEAFVNRGDRGDTAFKSFYERTKGEHSIAGVYFYSIMDCLVELSYAVFHDFFCRPHLYLKVGGDQQPVSLLLSALNARYGTEEFFLSKEQRAAIYNGLSVCELPS